MRGAPELCSRSPLERSARGISCSQVFLHHAHGAAKAISTTALEPALCQHATVSGWRDNQGLLPIGPQTSQHHPKQLVRIGELWHSAKALIPWASFACEPGENEFLHHAAYFPLGGIHGKLPKNQSRSSIRLRIVGVH